MRVSGQQAILTPYYFLQLVWNNILSLNGQEQVGGSFVNRTCLFNGQTIQVDKAAGGGLEPYVCQEADVVHPTSKKFEVMKKRTEWAVQYWSSALAVKRTRNPIVIQTGSTSRFGIPTSEAAHADVDLVVIMTAWPSPNKPIVGYASGIQSDQYSRSTVGHFNWIPSAIAEYREFDVSTKPLPQERPNLA